MEGDESDASCPLCYEEYSEEREVYSFRTVDQHGQPGTCAHSCCKECSDRLIGQADDSKIICPFCREKIVRSIKNLTANNFITLPQKILEKEKKKALKQQKKIEKEKQVIEELRDEIRRQQETIEQQRLSNEQETRKRIEEQRKLEEEESKRREETEKRRKKMAKKLEKDRAKQEEIFLERQKALEKQIQELNNQKNCVEAEKQKLQNTLNTTKKKLSEIKEDSEKSEEQKLKLQQEVVLIEAKLKEVIVKQNNATNNNGFGFKLSNLIDYYNPLNKHPSNFIHSIKNYQILHTLGSKRYSRVKKAIFNQKELVALKESLFFPLRSNLLVYLRTVTPEEQKRSEDSKIECFREIMLRFLFRNCNTINSITAVVSTYQVGKIYQVLPYMEYDLGYLIEQSVSVNNTSNVNIYDPAVAKLILFKILCAVKTLHSSNVVHLNISPLAVLISPTNRRSMDVQLGCLSRAVSIDSIGVDSVLNQKITNYSSPEQLHKSNIHHWKAIDMWAVGCIFAELFNPSRSAIFSATGAELLEQIDNMFDTPEYFSFIQDREARDLTKLMLEKSASRRISVDSALAHPFFTGIYALDKDIAPCSSVECHDDFIPHFLADHCPL